jgi:hypothetical protein
MHNVPKTGLDAPCESRNSRARAPPFVAPPFQVLLVGVLSPGGKDEMGAVHLPFGCSPSCRTHARRTPRLSFAFFPGRISHIT